MGGDERRGRALRAPRSNRRRPSRCAREPEEEGARPEDDVIPSGSRRGAVASHQAEKSTGDPDTARAPWRRNTLDFLVPPALDLEEPCFEAAWERRLQKAASAGTTKRAGEELHNEVQV
jgi:hypothetical protein